MPSNFFTRPHFEDRQHVQYSGDCITLSGDSKVSHTGKFTVLPTILDFTGTTTASTTTTVSNLTGYLNEGRVSGLQVYPPILKLSGSTGTTTVDVTGYVLTSRDSMGNMELMPVTGLSGSTSGTSYTFQNGITESSGTVKLGGTLTENTVIDGNSDAYNMTYEDLLGYFVYVNTGTPTIAPSELTMTSGEIYLLQTNTKGSRRVKLDNNGAFLENAPTGTEGGGQVRLDDDFTEVNYRPDSSLFTNTTLLKIEDGFIRVSNTDVSSSGIGGILLFDEDTNTVGQTGMVRFNGSNFQGYKSGSWVNLDETPSGSTSGLTDTFTTGATLDSGCTLTFDTNTTVGAYSVDLSPCLTDIYTTGATLDSGNTLTFDTNTTLGAYSVDLSPINTDTIFTGNTSGSCITDLHITNLYGCSPITIHDNLQNVTSTATTSNNFVNVFGSQNISTSNYTFIGGGTSNEITTSTYTSIIGGAGNGIDNSNYSFVGGGGANYIDQGSYNTIGGGKDNNITFNSSYSFIGGGEGNYLAVAANIGIVNGQDNTIGGNCDNSSIVGGRENYIGGDSIYSIISNGYKNSLNASSRTFIGSGQNNNINNSNYVSIVGGKGNTITKTTSFGTANRSSIIGGEDNYINNGALSSIVGGFNNNITNTSNNFIGGGRNNTISGSTSFTIGYQSSILGGQNNVVTHENSHVIGSDISSTRNDATFVNELIIVDISDIITGTSVSGLALDSNNNVIKTSNGVFNNTTSIRNVTTDITLSITDYTINVVASVNTTQTLPDATTIKGKIYNIKNSDSGTAVVTVATTSSQTIDGSSTQTVNSLNNIKVQSDGSNWIVL